MDFGNQNNTNNNPPALIVVVGVLTVVLAIGGLIIAQGTGALFPDQASAESEQIDGLFRILLGIGGALFLLAYKQRNWPEGDSRWMKQGNVAI